MHEQYRPTRAPLAEPSNRAPRSSVVAILLGGVLVDWGGTGVITSVLDSILMRAALMDQDAIDFEAPSSALFLWLIFAVIGALMSVAGGYVAASWAGRQPRTHAFGAGLTSATLSVLLVLVEVTRELDWLILATPPLGGRLYAFQRRPRRLGAGRHG